MFQKGRVTAAISPTNLITGKKFTRPHPLRQTHLSLSEALVTRADNTGRRQKEPEDSMETMERTAVRSRDIAVIGYDATTLTLEITFRAGGVYHYSGVPEEKIGRAHV